MSISFVQLRSRIPSRLQSIYIMSCLGLWFSFTGAGILLAQVTESKPVVIAKNKGDLYLLQGCPYTEGPAFFPTILYKLQNGQLQKVEDVISKGIGTSFIRDYHEQRLILIKESLPIPKAGESKFHLVWMDEPEKVDCRLLVYDPTKTEIQVNLLNLPDKGLAICSQLFGSQKRSLIGIILKDKTQASIPWTDYSQVILKGNAGLRISGNDRLLVSISQDGMPYIYGGDLEIVDLKLKKAGGLKELSQKNASLFIHNNYIAALVQTYNNDELNKRTKMDIWILDKSKEQWMKQNFSTGLGSFRGFGPWLAGYATELDMDSKRMSPGYKLRTENSTTCCIPLDKRIAEYEYYLPGRLLLFNIHNKRTIEIQTGDADSEIILVNENRVYYRVARSLFEAKISADGISEVKTLLTNDLVQDFHWAFFK